MLQAETYFSTEEAAIELRLTDGRIRQMLRAGELRGQKLGRRLWAIPASEIERVRRERNQDSESATTDSR